MSEVLEAAVKELQDTGQPDVVREVVAAELLQRQNLVSVTRFACGQRHLLG
jgi:hypothetical protein